MTTHTHRRLRSVAALLVLLLATAIAGSAQDPVLVFGHKNPDTDTVMSAIAAAHLLNAVGAPALAAMQGEVNPETAHALAIFGLETPRLLNGVAGRRVALVDFNEYSQGPEDLAAAETVLIVDHHRLGGMTTAAPPEVWMRPVGCTATILHGMYAFHRQDIPPAVAGGMLAAILSDTVVFRSVTTTEADRAAARDLAAIAGVNDMEALGRELLRIKSSLAGVDTRTLILRDYKEYAMGGAKVGIAQIESLDPGDLSGRRDELREELRRIRRESGSAVTLLMLTDVAREGTELEILADNPDAIAAVFGGKPGQACLWLEGVMSRKSQIVPVLEVFFADE